MEIRRLILNKIIERKESKMTKAQEVRGIINALYKAYGTDSGYLLGLELKYRDSVQVIVRFTLNHINEKGEG